MTRKFMPAHGFTIVELLIVVVVIAILAVISIVSYQGTTNQAHDSAVKSDMASAARKLEIALQGASAYPETNNASLQTVFEGFRFSANSYAIAPTVTRNITYCRTPLEFVLGALSKSGKSWIIRNSDLNVKEYSPGYNGNSMTSGDWCNQVLPGSTGNFSGYVSTDSPPWRTWTGVKP